MPLSCLTLIGINQDWSVSGTFEGHVIANTTFVVVGGVYKRNLNQLVQSNSLLDLSAFYWGH